MPDDDYEPRAKYYDEETRPEVILTEEKRGEIKDLLNSIEELPLGIDFTAWKIARLTKVLRLMNDIE